MDSINEFLDTKVSMSILLSSIVVTLGLSLSYTILGSSSKLKKPVSRARKQMLAAQGDETVWENDDESVDGSPGILDSFGRDDGESRLVMSNATDAFTFPPDTFLHLPSSYST